MTSFDLKIYVLLLSAFPIITGLSIYSCDRELYSNTKSITVIKIVEPDLYGLGMDMGISTEQIQELPVKSYTEFKLDTNSINGIVVKYPLSVFLIALGLFNAVWLTLLFRTLNKKSNKIL